MPYRPLPLCATLVAIILAGYARPPALARTVAVRGRPSINPVSPTCLLYTSPSPRD